MPTASPSSVATFIAKTEMSRNWASTQNTPSVTVTAMPPPITGKAAATRVPKISTRTMMAMGKVYVSAVLRSSAEICSMSAYTAGSPVRYVVRPVGASLARMAGIMPCTCSLLASNESTAKVACPSLEMKPASPVEAAVRTLRSLGNASRSRPARAAFTCARKAGLRASRLGLVNTIVSRAGPKPSRSCIAVWACWDGVVGLVKPPPLSSPGTCVVATMPATKATAHTSTMILRRL